MTNHLRITTYIYRTGEETNRHFAFWICARTLLSYCLHCHSLPVEWRCSKYHWQSFKTIKTMKSEQGNIKRQHFVEKLSCFTEILSKYCCILNKIVNQEKLFYNFQTGTEILKKLFDVTSKKKLKFENKFTFWLLKRQDRPYHLKRQTTSDKRQATNDKRQATDLG